MHVPLEVGRWRRRKADPRPSPLLSMVRETEAVRHGETMKALLANALLLALVAHGTAAADDAKKLRLITWADYAPPEAVAQFKQETGIQVEVTLSNNEEMISKLRATGGAGYDLAQPSQDRIASVTRDFGIYKPIDLSKVKTEEFQPALLEIVKRNATVDGKLYG